jgi:hypothetical protein
MAELTEGVREILRRDLGKLREEVLAYTDEALLWRDLPGTTNPGGVLAAHCAGNLRHFVGHVLGGSGYVRDRAAEFARRDRTRAELLEGIDAAVAEVTGALDRLPDEALGREFPEKVGGVTRTVGGQLIMLTAHLAYHLGQVNYHRRGVRREA